MSAKSGIEWTTSTWNPVTGCSKVSQGCKHCYAEREWPRLAAPRPKPNIYTGRAFTDVRCHPDKLDIPLRWTKPRRIFVNSMSDLFHEAVPFEFIDRVFAVMALATHHTFQVLTKRPERMLAYLSGDTENTVKGTAWEMLGRYPKYPNGGMQAPWPLPNVWTGVSIEDQATADERIPILLQTPAAVRWISAEPLLGHVDLKKWMGVSYRAGGWLGDDNPCIDWIVVGGESGPKARPMPPDWAKFLRDQCQAAHVPFFFKQWGEWAPLWADDEVETYPSCVITEDYPMARVGKKLAGRQLDGRTWDEYPIA